MAYLRELPVYWCASCGGRATVELVNARGTPYGWYCRKHGEAMRKALQARELASP